MIDLFFVDTNLLVYTRDLGDPSKQTRAEAWMHRLWDERCGVLSPQILREYYAVVTRKALYSHQTATVRQDIRNLTSWIAPECMVEPLEEAWAVQDRYGLSFWDSLMVASAMVAGCRWLLTEDLQEGQIFGKLTTVSPFRLAPDEL